MITVTYFTVEQKDINSWSKVWNNGDQITDRAEAEALLEKEKNHYCGWLASELTKATDKDVIAHLGKLIDNIEFRIVEENKTFTHASLHLWTDVHAYEIVRVVSDKTIEVRPMIAKHDISHLNQQAGGFCGHVAEQRNQKVTYTSDPEAQKIKIRRKKNDPHFWTHKGRRFTLQEKPYAFHDYNF